MTRHANRRDAVEREIINALEKAGCTVQQLNGKDIPDLLVGRAKKNYLLEVKDPETGKLSPGQRTWHDAWNGDVDEIRTVDDALRAVEIMK